MSKFTDIEGDSWHISIDINAVRKLRDELDVNILDLVADDGKLLGKISSDPVLMVDIISVLVTDQIVKKGLNATIFASRLTGDVLGLAYDALYEAIAFFFPTPKRLILERLGSKLRSIESSLGSEVMELLDNLNPAEIARQISKG